MRRLARGLLAVGVALLGLVALVGVASGRELPVGAAGPDADALARRIEAGVGKAAWDDLGAVRWTAVGGNEHFWDRARSYHRVRFDGLTVYVDLRTQTGRAFRGADATGEELTGAEADDAVKRAWAWFCNDSFWLNPALKLFDDGVTRGIVAGREGDELLVTFASGGTTPGDAYLFEVGEDGTPTAFRMWVAILPLKGLRVTLRDWVTIPGGARYLQVRRMGPLPLRIDDVAVAGTAAEIEPGPDPFAPLVERAAAASPGGSSSPAGARMPLVIGHRGSPGRLPDHTIEGYTLAVEQGADAIEPDLVVSKDGVLVARHENELGGTTDVADKFPDRRRTAVVDGASVTGWFAEDFTLAELKTLRARQPWPDRPHDHDGEYTIPTFDEVLELAARLGVERGRVVRVVPETKHPTYFRELGLPLEPRVIDALRRHGLLDSPDVLIQSFELSNLAELGAAGKAPRLWLVGDPREPIPHDGRAGAEVLADLPALRAKVEAIGIPRELVWGPDGPTDLVARAHAAGLQVYVWTFRAERPGPAGDLETELRWFYDQGVDGVFADQPDVAARVRDRW